ncbi:hypothetical protein LX32DRAFT_226782 [Colletotrichum zoysiae]|uniref:Uncharacterized protein n=1 Tax=Colletotrichum zoysiae TaxID=1216348 RepID=A0AAD9M3U4_9PEZI|nr:hypothetical protein LX32DRAFT_226782 [Colletotrichum zoysiae]
MTDSGRGRLGHTVRTCFVAYVSPKAKAWLPPPLPSQQAGGASGCRGGPIWDDERRVVELHCHKGGSVDLESPSTVPRFRGSAWWAWGALLLYEWSTISYARLARYSVARDLCGHLYYVTSEEIHGTNTSVAGGPSQTCDKRSSQIEAGGDGWWGCGQQRGRREGGAGKYGRKV